MTTHHRRTIEAPTVNESPFPVSSDDPTATKTIRNRYGAEMYRRFRALKSAIVTGVVERDAFGIADLDPEERSGPRTPASFTARDLAANPLGPPEDPERFADFDECVEELAGDPDLSREDAREICGAWEQRVKSNAEFEAAQGREGGAGAGINIEPPREGEFAYPSDERKVSEFVDWLDREVDRGILGANPSASGRRVAAAEPWQNTYLRSAYRKGVNHADSFLVDSGVISRSEMLDDVFQPVKHADSAGLLYVRSYNELDGVTDAMSQEMSRVLAEGITRGDHPREIARSLNDRVDNVGLHRGRMIARTETIRAHNEAALNRYEDMGDRLEGVTLLQEHLTAGDNRVCPECEALAGTVYTIREARGRIPIHPNCRCTWLPTDSRDVPPGKGGTATAEERVAEIFEATADLPPDEQVDRVSEFLSQNTRYGHASRTPSVDLSGFDPERSRAVANVMMKLEHLDVFEPIDKGWCSVATADEVRNSPGLSDALAWAKGKNVTFNSDKYTKEGVTRLVDRGWLTGRFARGDFNPLESGVVHEFGHVFHLEGLKDRPGTLRAVRDGRFSRRLEDSIGGKISRYAAVNPAEFVAETFVRVAYDMPVSPDHMALYTRYGGPDPDTFRGFMVEERVASNMGGSPEEDSDAGPRGNVERTAAGNFPEDIPPELRAEAEAVHEGFAEALAALDEE